MNPLYLIRRHPIFIILSFLICLLLSSKAMALICRAGQHTSSDYPIGSTKKTVSIPPIYISQKDIVPGTILWRSQNYNMTFTCWDTDQHPEGEDAYIYWNPQGGLDQIPAGLSVGVNINGIDYDNINQYDAQRGPDLGQGTLPSILHGLMPCPFCDDGDVASPNSLSLHYYIYIKATGQKLVRSNLTARLSQFISLFQIDGEGGLRGGKNSNFNTYLEGFNKIHIIDCQPHLQINANDGNTINFGTLSAGDAVAGKLAREVPFNVVAYLTGRDCSGQSLYLTFTSISQQKRNRMIIPNNNPGVGIFITQQVNGANQKVKFNTPTIFGDVIQPGEEQITEHYMANLRWLSNHPDIGPFSAAALLTLTFR